MDNFLKEIMPYVWLLISAVVVALLKTVRDVSVKSINEWGQRQTVLKAIDKYSNEIKVAKNIWGIVEEHFRIKKYLLNISEGKIKMFNDLLLKQIPYLQQSDIDHLRQSIAGEVNKYKGILNTPLEVADEVTVTKE